VKKSLLAGDKDRMLWRKSLHVPGNTPENHGSNFSTQGTKQVPEMQLLPPDGEENHHVV